MRTVLLVALAVTAVCGVMVGESKDRRCIATVGAVVPHYQATQIESDDPGRRAEATTADACCELCYAIDGCQAAVLLGPRALEAARSAAAAEPSGAVDDPEYEPIPGGDGRPCVLFTAVERTKNDPKSDVTLLLPFGLM